MGDKDRSFSKLEAYITKALLINLLLFILFLISSGIGVIWLKVICAIFSVLIPAMCILYLICVKEWRKRRAQWMVSASLSLLICTILSLILQYPSPM